jgi:hypothetical protein
MGWLGEEQNRRPGKQESGEPHHPRQDKSNMHSETPFLEYRLQVVSSWPESDRKRATIDAILSQMERSENEDPKRGLAR